MTSNVPPAKTATDAAKEATLKPRSNRRASARLRVLVAARDMFSANGFGPTTMDQIAGRARMSTGNLYRYFPSKEALVHEVVEQVRQEVEEPFLQAERLAAFEEALGSHYNRHLRSSGAGFATLQVAIWSEACRDAKVAQSCRRLEVTLRRALRRAVGRRSCPPADAAFVVLACITGGLYRRRALDADFNPESEIPLAQGAIRSFLASLHESG